MVRPKPVRLIRASAGSGKTFALTAHYLTLLFSGQANFRDILAVTFTNKATAEMKSRILSALLNLSQHGFQRSPFASLLREQFPGTSDEQIRLKAAEIYSSILHDYGRFSISTIDKFVQQIVRSFAFELNLESGYKVELKQDKIKDELVRLLNRHLANDPDLLDWVTRIAIDRISDGKDWDYTHTLKDLAGEIFKEKYYPFERAMTLMGADQAAEFTRLREAVTQGISEFREGVLSRTALARQIFTASGILKEELANKSRNGLFNLERINETQLDKVGALRDFVDNFEQWPNKALKDHSAVEDLYAQLNPAIKDLVSFYDEGCRRYETLQAINKNATYLRLMQVMREMLSIYRAENRAIPISDAQWLIRNITNPDDGNANPSFIWEKTGNQYKYFLFDEFQDTSEGQWSNFLPLVENAVSQTAGQQPEHLMVGDVKQSIYRWRSSDWRILHSRIARDLRDDNVGEEILLYNRRSSENIIRFNNFLYRQLPATLQSQLNNVFDESQLDTVDQAWYSENTQVIQKAYETSHQDVTESTPKGGRINLRFFEKGEEPEDSDEPIAQAYAVDQIIELLSGGMKMRDIAILVRTNAEAEAILKCMFSPANHLRLSQATNTIFQAVSGEALKIANNPAVQLLTSTFRLIASREEDSGLLKAECARLYQDLKSAEGDIIPIPPEDWISLSTKSIIHLGHILPERLCLEFDGLKRLPLAELTEKLIHIYQPPPGHLPYILAFRDQISVFSAGGDQGLTSFIRWWDQEGCDKTLPASQDQDAVQVMTIHKSKGLEFTAVILPFVNWKLNTSSGFNRKLLWVDAAGAGFEQFKTLPVDYTKALSQTAFAVNYFEEMLLSYMDVLNTLYVATTRARCYLSIICPSLADAPKSGAINDLQQVLFEMLNSAEANALGFETTENEFRLGTMPVPSAGKEDSHSGTFILSDYPVNELVSARFQRPQPDPGSWDNGRQRRGVAIHSLLASLTRPDGLDSLVSRKIQEGALREEERTEVSDAVTRVLEHPQIVEWFKQADSVISEQDIILEDGSVKRPDKLFIIGSRVVLLDFKFGLEHSRYRADMAVYRDTLLRMGRFSEVEAFLWYSEGNKLEKI